MSQKLTALALVALSSILLGACAGNGPPPPGYVGESWRRHVNRCLRAYPRYNPRTDLIERSDGPARCPL